MRKAGNLDLQYLDKYNKRCVMVLKWHSTRFLGWDMSHLRDDASPLWDQLWGCGTWGLWRSDCQGTGGRSIPVSWPPDFTAVVRRYCNSKYTKNCRKTREFAPFCHLSQLSGCINFVRSFLDSSQLGVGSRWCWYLWTLPIHAKNIAIYVKNAKNDHKTRDLALFVTSCAIGWLLNCLVSFLRFQSTMFMP